MSIYLNGHIHPTRISLCRIGVSPAYSNVGSLFIKLNLLPYRGGKKDSLEKTEEKGYSIKKINRKVKIH